MTDYGWDEDLLKNYWKDIPDKTRYSSGVAATKTRAALTNAFNNSNTEALVSDYTNVPNYKIDYSAPGPNDINFKKAMDLNVNQDLTNTSKTAQAMEGAVGSRVQAGIKAALDKALSPRRGDEGANKSQGALNQNSKSWENYYIEDITDIPNWYA